MPIDTLYPTPIYYSQVENFDAIQTEVASVVEKTNFGTVSDWGSPHQLSDPTFEGNVLNEKNMTSLTSEIHSHIRKYLEGLTFQFSPNYKDGATYNVVSSWISKYKKREYAPTHSHGHHEISGVYYHQVTEEQGNFFFECPTPQLTSSFLYNHLSYHTKISPVKGLLLLFPGYLYHGVYANNTDDDRISLSFNVSFQKPYF